MMVKYDLNIIEKLATEAKFKLLREIAGKIVELEVNGYFKELLSNGSSSVLIQNGQGFIENNIIKLEKEKTVRIKGYFDDSRKIILECGMKAPDTDYELFSSIIKPLIEYQLKRSL